MRAWRSSARRRGSSPRARPCSLCSGQTTSTLSKPGSCRARDRARAACAIWRRRCPSASRRAWSAWASSSTGGRRASICAAPASLAPGGATWLLVSVPALGAASLAPRAPADVRDAPKPDEPAPPDFSEPPPPKSRFLWTLDEEGRFGAAHPALAAAVGANAPRRGETVETLLRRVELERGDELVRVIAERQTFSRRHRRLAALGRGSATADRAFGRAPVRPPSRISGLSRLWGAWRRSRRAASAGGRLGDGACRGSLTPGDVDARTEPDAWRGARRRRIGRGVRGCKPCREALRAPHRSTSAAGEIQPR